MPVLELLMGGDESKRWQTVETAFARDADRITMMLPQLSYSQIKRKYQALVPQYAAKDLPEWLMRELRRRVAERILVAATFKQCNKAVAARAFVALQREGFTDSYQLLIMALIYVKYLQERGAAERARAVLRAALQDIYRARAEGERVYGLVKLTSEAEKRLREVEGAKPRLSPRTL